MKEKCEDEMKRISGLRWLPWIGDKYECLCNRIFVLGESHYLHGDYSSEDIESDMLYTRDVIGSYVDKGRSAGKQYKMYEPIEKILKGALLDSDSTRETVWHSLAYMNIVQRVLKQKSGKKDWEDFLNGWKVVLQVIRVLRPRIVVCFSTGKLLNRNNFNRLKEFKGEMAFKYTISETRDSGDRISKVHVANPGMIAFDYDSSIPVVFLQHASRIKRFEEWRDVLCRHCKSDSR